MTTQQITKNGFNDRQNIYVGLDVHKKNWGVSILGEQLEHKTFMQSAEPAQLSKYLEKHFPDSNYYAAYEAGFCGFWIAHELEKKGVNTIVVNPSDIPTTNKEKKQKSDKRDAKKIAHSLRNGSLTGIYIPEDDVLQDRMLVRMRQKLLEDIKRCKCRIKSQMNLFGIHIPEELDKSYWTKALRAFIRQDNFTGSGQLILVTLMDELEAIELLKKRTDKAIGELANTKHQSLVELLSSIPGIGTLAAMTLIVELVDIKRFKTADQLHSFVGFIPTIYASGAKEKIGNITKRSNRHLRTILVQCAWRAAKIDPTLMVDYDILCRKMKANKAIIRIAKKLLNRVRYVWTTENKLENTYTT